MPRWPLTAMLSQFLHHPDLSFTPSYSMISNFLCSGICSIKTCLHSTTLGNSIFILIFVDLIFYRLVIMEKKPEPKPRSNDAPSTDVTRDRIASILSASFVMSEVTTCWKGPRYLAYDNMTRVCAPFSRGQDIRISPPQP